MVREEGLEPETVMGKEVRSEVVPQKAESVCEQIRKKIIRGEYPPGSPLSEIPLSREYGVTRARIRQALQKLEEESLVERFPYRGAFVKSITPKELQEIFEMREALESMAARLAARRRDEETLKALQLLFEKYRKSSATSHLQKKIEIGERLHQFIVESSKNGKIIEAMQRLRFPIMRIWEVGFRIPDRIQNAFREHLAILRAIAEGKEALAERTMREHITNAFKDYIQVTMLQEAGRANSPKRKGRPRRRSSRSRSL
jgi:DNA-binding GntR family transcriptional regulator